MSDQCRELALTLQQNHSVQDFLFHLFVPSRPLHNTPPSILPPTCQDTNIQIPSSSSQLEVDSSTKMLEFCKIKYFQVLDLQYELKNNGGDPSTAKFLFKDDLEYALKEAEEQTMELWCSSRRPPEENEWEEKEQILSHFISEANSAVQIENSKSPTRYVDEVRNKISKQIKEFKEIFEVNYPELCSESTTKTLGKGEADPNLRKFYSPENLKRTVDCMISQVTKSCQQFAVKLNAFSEQGVESTLIFAQLQKEASDWGSNLIGKNDNYMIKFEEYVNQWIISQFVNEARSELKSDDMWKRKPLDFKSTLQLIDMKLKGLKQPFLREIQTICADFALDNSTQLLDHYKGVLKKHRDDIRAEAVMRWRERCKNSNKKYYDKLKQLQAPRCTTSTPQFVLDIYGRHIEEARSEVEANLREIKEEPLSPILSDDDDDVYNDEGSCRTVLIAEWNDENLDGPTSTNDHRTSPIPCTSSAAACCWYDGNSVDDGQNNKRRKF